MDGEVQSQPADDSEVESLASLPPVVIEQNEDVMFPAVKIEPVESTTLVDEESESDEAVDSASAEESLAQEHQDLVSNRSRCKHNEFTHFPKSTSCEICSLCKTYRA